MSPETSAEERKAQYASIDLDDLVRDIRAALLDADKFEGKARQHRVVAGQRLIDLRERIERGEAGEGVQWWDWYKTKFTRERKEIERIIRLANDCFNGEAPS